MPGVRSALAALVLRGAFHFRHTEETIADVV